jgi:hypothetical protein
MVISPSPSFAAAIWVNEPFGRQKNDYCKTANLQLLRSGEKITGCDELGEEETDAAGVSRNV